MGALERERRRVMKEGVLRGESYQEIGSLEEIMAGSNAGEE